MSTGFGIRCSSKSRQPQCDQQRQIPLPINVTPNESIEENLDVFVATANHSTTPGLDTNSGLDRLNPVRTLQRAAEIVREKGYNNRATIFLLCDSPGTVTNHIVGTEQNNALNLSNGLNGDQRADTIIRSDELITLGTTNVVSVSTDTPARNYMSRIVVGSTANMRPGYILEWTGAQLFRLIVGEIVNGTTIEVPYDSNAQQLPSGGDTLTIVRPCANIQLFGSTTFVGNANNVTFTQVTIGLNSNASSTTKSLTFKGLRPSLGLAAIHNEDQTNIGNVGGVINFDSTERYNSSSTSYLGYTYGTTGDTTAGNQINIQFVPTTARLTSSLFDFADFAIQNFVAFVNVIIFRQPERINVTRFGALTLSGFHIHDPVLNSPAGGNALASLLSGVAGSLDLVNGIINGTTADTAPTVSTFDLGRSITASLTNVNIISDSATPSAINMGTANSIAYNLASGANPFLAGVYTISNDNASPTIVIREASKMSVEAIENAPVNITNAGAGLAINVLRQSQLNLTGATAPNVITLSTGGDTSLAVRHSSEASLLNVDLDGAVDDIAINQGSRIVASTVNLNGAGTIDIGTLGSGTAPPAAGEVILNVTTVNTASAGDGSMYTTIV